MLLLDGVSISTICSCVHVCLFGHRVVAENDFLHTLLNKLTTLRGDSGGQGTVLQLQAFCVNSLPKLAFLYALDCVCCSHLWSNKMAVSHRILASSLCSVDENEGHYPDG